MTKVFVVVHDFYSHDMFVDSSAKTGDPQVVGVYTTRKLANKQIRKDADDYVRSFNLDQPVKKK